jgi:hypothetical protein
LKERRFRETDSEEDSQGEDSQGDQGDQGDQGVREFQGASTASAHREFSLGSGEFHREIAGIREFFLVKQLSGFRPPGSPDLPVNVRCTADLL